MEKWKSTDNMIKAVRIVDMMKRGNIGFVPVPIIGEADEEGLWAMSKYRLEKIFEALEQEEGLQDVLNKE